MRLHRHAGTPEERILNKLLDSAQLSMTGRNRRPFTRPALWPWQRTLQLAISMRPRREQPSIKEKRLINGKWTRDY